MKFICLGNYRQSEQNKKFSFFLCFATETIRQDVRRRRERGGDKKTKISINLMRLEMRKISNDFFLVPHSTICLIFFPSVICQYVHMYAWVL